MTTSLITFLVIKAFLLLGALLYSFAALRSIGEMTAYVTTSTSEVKFSPGIIIAPSILWTAFWVLTQISI